MTCNRLQLLARSAKSITTVALASLLSVSCVTTQQTGEIPETVLITGSLVRESGASQYPPPAVYLRHPGARPAPAPAPPPPPPPPAYWQYQNTENYPHARPNAAKVTAEEPVSTFSVDVDTAAYANVRRFLNDGVLPPVDAVRVEEMINYFDYAYALPGDRTTPFGTTVAIYPTPWNQDTRIMHVGIKGFDLPRRERPRSNLVFLIDTSGSMEAENKLPLLKRSFRMLVNELRAEDRVAIVTYAGTVGVALPSTSGADKTRILNAIDRLRADGGTAGGEGIRVAYELAKENFDRHGINRVLLATDGDFNVGITDPKVLEDFVAHERTNDIFLTVLGFGTGNYKDLMMQKLAQAGNGTAAYIDTVHEARKVFVDELGSTLFTIAKDVKIQVEFNPARVAEYRLIGYETRTLSRSDFNNDKVDAGDIGAGHSVTALYEITPTGSRSRTSDPLRYGSDMVPSVGLADEVAFLKIRYKLPTEDESRLIVRAIDDRDIETAFAAVPLDLRFAAAVAGAGQLLRRDPNIKDFDFDRAIGIAQAARGEDPFGYRAEFVQLLRAAQSAESTRTLSRSSYGGGR